MVENQQIPIACDFNAIPADERAAHAASAQQLFAAVLEVKELGDGFGFRFPAETHFLRALADFIANERLCCPFFQFEVVVEPQSAAFWLRLRGSEDVKAFVREEFSSIVHESTVGAGVLR